MSDKSESLKKLGNEAFKAKDFESAVNHFTNAIESDPKKIELYSNRSASYAKLDKLEEAIVDAEKCITLDPSWGKGYARKASALALKGDVDRAIACYSAGLKVDPENGNLKQGLEKVKSASTTKKKKKKKRGKKKSKPVEESHVDHVIGIDLGTTYSCVGVWINGDVKIIENNDGQKTIPSYVSFDKLTGMRKVGHAAKNQMTRNPEGTVYDVKRIIGQRWNDAGVQDDISKMNFKCVREEERPMISVNVKGEELKFAPEEISAMVLNNCKELAEDYLGHKVTRAVVTVPAYFNDAQRQATKLAGKVAGLDILRIINEPTAAALSYGMDNKTKEGKPLNVVIFDLGGGTFDVSILTIENGVFQVKATGGDTRLGGEDFDNNLINHLLAEIRRQGLADPTEDSRSMQRLRKASEIAKRDLSSSQSTEISLDAFMSNSTNFRYRLSREKFETMNKGPFMNCIETVKRVLKDSKLKASEIDEIVLVGGSTRIPKLQEMLVDLFEGKALCKKLNPDEAVAYGAAVQGAILSGKRNSKTDSLLLMDVTPLSLGIEVTGRVMSVIIPRNTPIPVVKTQTYTTERDYQTTEIVSVYEGERMSTKENNLLGEFNITGIEKAKRGEPKIDVSFTLDSNGILNVNAKDQKTGAEAKIEISNRSKATTEEIDRMVAEAKKCREEDEEKLRRVEARNELEFMIYDCIAMAKEAAQANELKFSEGLATAAEKEQTWLDANYETGKPGDMSMRKMALERRMNGKLELKGKGRKSKK